MLSWLCSHSDGKDNRNIVTPKDTELEYIH